MHILLKQLDKKAQLPTQAREGDFCYDVIAVSEEEVAPNVWRYGMGFAYEIDRDTIELGKWEETFGVTITGVTKEGTYEAEPNIVKHGFYLGSKFYSNVKLSIDFRPRSSIWKTGMILSNCVGTLDEFYRGEMMAVFYHVMPNMPRYKVGDKIGQIKLGITLPLNFEWGDINTDTERGTGGFGSTGR